ncbi:P2Y purinoceptor 1-like [Microcaecilia unicolor]|uniref:P2Y purinoceptor 1-like n=1 Tax=Microcaecilia unicolor TaxID=1415580 RepID=A0A6P7XZI7_9AMPH|nr:P2Y purinoceptor 1-like [Microcaecilia unicolor]
MKNVNDFCEPEGTVLGAIQRTLIPGTFLFILLVGLPLNLSVLWILIARVKRWNRSTVFLCNLVLADITWILTLPVLITYHLNQLHWVFGDAVCKATRTVYHICYYCSIYFVTCLGVDRYLAIVHPLKSLSLLSKQRSLRICFSIWLLTCIFSVPVSYMAGTQSCQSNRTTCSLYVFSSATSTSLPFSITSTTLGCLLPLSSIFYCYCSSVGQLRRTGFQRAHKRGALTSFMYAALIVFALLYLPYHASRNTCIFLRAFRASATSSIRAADTLFFALMAVCSLNSCINPLFCFLTGGDFREQVSKLVFSCRQKKPWQRGPGLATVCPVE